MALANGLKKFSEHGNMVVSGQNGQKVLDFYNQTLDIIASR